MKKSDKRIVNRMNIVFFLILLFSFFVIGKIFYIQNNHKQDPSVLIETIKNVENLVAIWRWRYLTVAGKMSVFESLAFSKVIFISYLSYVPPAIINKIEALQKEFIWNGKTPKVKHTTLISNYEDGGLKDIDIRAKLKSLHLSWIKRLYSQNFHPWKNIPLKLIENFIKQEIFYSNIMIKLPNMFPKFYICIMDNWSELRQQPLILDFILMQHIWFNQFIIVSNRPIKKLFPFQLFVGNLFEDNVQIPCLAFKEKFNLHDNDYFKWRQVISSIPSNWKSIITNSDVQPNPPKIQHLLQLSRPLPLEKLTSKQSIRKFEVIL